MDTGSADTKQLEEWFQKTQAGDEEAWNALFGFLQRRFEAIAYKMLGSKRNPVFSGSDVIQEMCSRLLKVVRESPTSVTSLEHFLGLAGKHLRWAALDLLRKQDMPHLESFAPSDTSQSGYPIPASTTTGLDSRQAWERFHQLIDEEGVLEPREREAFTLSWYQGLEPAQIAQLLSVSVRTVRRDLSNVREKLSRHIDLNLLK